jgi:hypothetical protein
MKQRTSRPPVIVDGVTFLSYRVGIGVYRLRSEDDRAAVWRRSPLTWCAQVDDKMLGRLFRSEASALQACVKALKSP